ncbi:UNVERIFIED_ORG: integrase [Comamonas terrigena]
MDSRPGYHRIANQFLIDIGLGMWSLSTRGVEQASAMLLTASTMHNYAHWLANYLEYCHVRGKDPLHAEYKVDLIQAYQGEMNIGSWSRDNTGLSAKTINLRVDIVCMFLLWAADKGLRKKFHIPKIRRTIPAESPHSSGARTSKTIEVRRGKIREGKRRLGFPDAIKIGAWLSHLRNKCPVEGLIAELILETALRRAEAAAWRVDTLPIDPADWQIVNPENPVEHQAICVLLRHSTKGHSYGKDHGDKLGPEGNILLPMPIALKLHHYREKVRPKALTIALRKAKSVREANFLREHTVHLFLNPNTGERYSGQQIYDFWTHKSTQCPRGWSPHLARDFWACSVLWKHLEAQKELVDKITKNEASPSSLKILALDIQGFIQLTIQPQLRHSSLETCMIYLQWVSDRLGVNMNFHENYAQQLTETPLGEEDG